jgi:hypothetical protein
MTAFVNFILYIGLVGFLPVGILAAVRAIARKRGLGLGEGGTAQDPAQEPDYRRWQGRRNR